jgi:ATP-dependent exoDNAse (exonuclease V) beta subunit
VIFDSSGLGLESRQSRERERLRELVRLLYVTLTRAGRSLIVPWGPEHESAHPKSFAGLWGLTAAELSRAEGPLPPLEQAVVGAAPEADDFVLAPAGTPVPAAELARRILPHELAKSVDIPRSARHESFQDRPSPLGEGPDPLEYGTWWHDTMEFFPWGSDPARIDSYGARAVARAASLGFSERARSEWSLFVSSESLRILGDRRWSRQSEIGIFAPHGELEWIDGVIDLALHDPSARELWIVDWKTNRRRVGENDDAFFDRLRLDYTPQLRAYARSASPFFEGSTVRAYLYSTVAGALREIAPLGF